MNALQRSQRRLTHSTLAAFAVLVTTLGAAAAPALPPSPNAPSAPPAQSSASARAFVRLEVPKRTLYAGESVPITVRAYYRVDTGVTVTGAPTVTGTDFTLRAGDPVQGSAVLGGVSYRVLTWKDHLSPVKAGRYALTVDIPSTLEWQDIVQRPAPVDAQDDDELADPFGNDPFFGGSGAFQQMHHQMQRMMQQAFAEPEVGAVQRRALVLRAPQVAVDVQSVPLVGRPTGFDGAVGQFRLAAHADTASVRVGEPITLSFRVTGEGNFDRVDLPGLPASSDWKTYHPNSTSGPSDKTFHQAVVPLRAGIAAIPSTSLSYFDPESAKFVTTASASIPVTVAPGAGAAATANGNVPNAASGPVLSANADSAGRPIASLEPVFTRPWFWIAQGSGAAVLGALALALGTRKRLRADANRTRRREAERAVGSLRGAMDRALAAQDRAAFFVAARSAIQQALGARWQLEASAISLSEIEARLGPEEADKLRAVFDADAARFSGASQRQEDLAPWKDIVERELEHLNHLEAA
ncbi:MAG: BatD family protein [Polyangiaceae bacterium]